MTTTHTEIKNEIINLEIKLLEAFKNRDLKTIDELLHNDSLFIYPNGQSITKNIVLENYRSGNSAFSTVVSGDQIINIIDDTAVVSINLELKGKYFDEIISSQFRYLRVWKKFDDNWRVIAVSGVPINK